MVDILLQLDLNQSSRHGYTYFIYLLAFQGAELLTTWLLISLVFLLANIFNNSAVAVSVEIVGYFDERSRKLFNQLIVKWEWIKWDPLTILDYPSQIRPLGTYLHLTKLSLNQLAAGNLVYIIIFLAIGYLVFKKRNV